MDKTGLTLTEASTIARQHETTCTEASAKGMKAAISATAGEIRRVLPRVAKPTPAPRRPECANCSKGGHLAGGERCSARGQEFHASGLTGHFASKCRATTLFQRPAARRQGDKPKPKPRKFPSSKPRLTARLVEEEDPVNRQDRTRDDFAFSVDTTTDHGH